MGRRVYLRRARGRRRGRRRRRRRRRRLPRKRKRREESSKNTTNRAIGNVHIYRMGVAPVRRHVTPECGVPLPGAGVYSNKTIQPNKRVCVRR